MMNSELLTNNNNSKHIYGSILFQIAPKNGITDACSTADCCPLLAIYPRCCPRHAPDMPQMMPQTCPDDAPDDGDVVLKEY